MDFEGVFFVFFLVKKKHPHGVSDVVFKNVDQQTPAFVLKDPRNSILGNLKKNHRFTSTTFTTF